MIVSLSIVIPSFNVEGYLEKCVKKLLPQLNETDEILIIDDGSTDDTSIIADNLCLVDNKISVLHKENGGLSSARNYGIQHATGQFIAFVDPDDYVSDDYLSFFHQNITLEIDALGFGLCRVEDNKKIADVYPLLTGKFLGTQIQEKVLPEILSNRQIFKRSLILGSACTYFYRRQFLIDNMILFHSERLYLNEDMFFNLEVFVHAESIIFSQKVLYIYVSRAGSLTQQFHPNIYDTKKNLGLAFEKILRENHLDTAMQERMDGFWIKGIYECIVHAVWQYSKYSSKEQHARVKLYLNDNYLRLALKRFPWKKLNLKGKILYFLMRYRMHICIIWGYKLIDKTS